MPPKLIPFFYLPTIIDIDPKYLEAAYEQFDDYREKCLFLEEEKKENWQLYQKLKKYKPGIYDTLFGYYALKGDGCIEYFEIVQTIKKEISEGEKIFRSMGWEGRIVGAILDLLIPKFLIQYKSFLKKHFEYDKLLGEEIEHCKKCIDIIKDEKNSEGVNKPPKIYIPQNSLNIAYNNKRGKIIADRETMEQKMEIGEYMFYDKEENNRPEIFGLIYNHLEVIHSMPKSFQKLDKLLLIEKELKRLYEGFKEVTPEIVIHFRYAKYSLSHRYPEVVYYIEAAAERMKRIYKRDDQLLGDIWSLVPSQIKEIEQVLRTIDSEKEYLEKSNELKIKFGGDASEELIASKTIKLEAMKDERLETIVWNGKPEQLRKLFEGLTISKIINDCEVEIFLAHFKIRKGIFKSGITEFSKLQWNIDDNDFAGMIAVLVEKKLVPNHKKYKAFCSHFVNSRGEDFKNLAQSGNYMKNYSNLDEKLMEVLKNL